MCGSKTVNNTTTTERMNDLPEWAKPYFERNIARAEAEFGKPYEAYRGERLAATDPNVTAGREGLVNVAGTGVPGLGAAQDYNTAGMQRATELGCASVHQNNGRWMPCSDEAELHRMLRKQ